MHPQLQPILFGALLCVAVIAAADDAPSAQPVKSPKQKMHACMVNERAKSNSMSKEDMKKLCAQKLQSEDNHPSRPQIDSKS